MNQVFSALSWQTEAVAAVVPFSMEPVAVSPLFARLFSNGESLMQGELNLKQEDFAFGRIVRAYLFILKQCFQMDEALQYPIVRTVRDPETGLDRYYRMELDFRFVTARPVGESPRELQEEERTRLIDALTDPEAMRSLLPPEDYEICGLTLIRMLDVTQSEVLSLLIAPLLYQGQCVGTMDLGLPDVNGFGPMSELILEQLRPIFALTVKKSLYGVADIRGSSQERNQAIESDLTEHLNLARNVLLTADQIKPMLLVQEVIHRLEGYQSSLSRGLDSGEDLSVIDFVSREVEPLFPLLQGFGPGVREAVDTYQTALDPQVGTVYSLRKDFENSLALLNDRLCTFLDQEEAALQQLVPHYFERHKTDGLDYLIYLGDSLLENGGFDPAYLKNFRIWQLKAACGLAGIAEELKSSLPVPLDIAQLILIQSSPISIRFRYDEKRFDVDGAYDVRQEIIKSRLDKATVKRTGERLTQPGTIAVIYSSRAEAQEMHEHIDYLCARGFLLENREQLKLADLPGVQGLKALRVGVDLQSQGSASC